MSATVSVVIPTYNNAEYIGETMEAVLAQSYSELEVIVADHSSGDATPSIIESYSSDSRVTVLSPTPVGGGAKANWDRVSKAATGTYLKLVCGDDLIHPELVATQVRALEENPSAVLAASRRDVIDAHNKSLVRGRGLGILVGPHEGAAAIRATVRAGTNLFGEPACVLMRRDSLERTGWWDDTSPYLIDEASYANVLLTGDFVGVPESLAGFRISDSQWSVRLMRQQAEQAAQFHNAIRDAHPEIVSNADRVIGNLNARKAALMRRLAYLYLHNRMNRADAR